MTSVSNTAVTESNALSFLRKVVLVELDFEELPEPYWRCFHVVGIVFPVEGVCDQACFMVRGMSDDCPFPRELFFDDIRTIWALRHRDRQSSGTVLGRIAHPNLWRSGAALPAHRNAQGVAMNGSTGAAHP